MDHESAAKTQTAEENSAPTTSADSASPAPTPALPDGPKSRPGAPILLYGPTLAQRRSDRVTDFGSNLGELIQLMYDTLAERGGIGLAAPQIGVFDQVAIIHHPDCERVMVNPEILEGRGGKLEWEACLSLPGCSTRGKIVNNRARVARFETVVVSYQDVDGAWKEETISEYPARIVQHEVDHLAGKFFIDRAHAVARKLVLEKLANFVRLSGQSANR